MRGKGPVRRRDGAGMGITPAYAGKSSQYGLRGWFFQDHPRVCGEKIPLHIRAKVALGSPPRMRGKDGVNDSAQAVTGITPACAGKRDKAGLPFAPVRDHPRVCGEKTSASSLFNTAAGSPPRVRGKELRVETCFSHDGITPAYAGKRVSRSRAKTGEWDHPRVCGEKTPFSENSFTKSGSPPRMRGKAEPDCMGTLEGGITPAYAGKRSLPLMQASSSQDHPRVCGEKRSISIFSRQALGSPPRMRGKALQLPLCILDMRITPAYAGKSNTFLCKGLTARDHPRGCGEKGLIKVSACGREGSPPRMRGKAVPLRSATASGCRGPSVPEYDAPP